MVPVAAGVFPMLGEHHGQWQFTLDLLRIRGAAKCAPGEPVGIHAVVSCSSALSLRVERKRENVGDGKLPLRKARADLRGMLASRCGRYLLPKPRAGECHLCKTVVSRVAALHPDIDAAACCSRLVGIRMTLGGNRKSIGANVELQIGRS